MEVLIVLALILNAWLVASRRWRRFIAPVAIAMLLGIIATSTVAIELAFKAMTLPLPEDQGDLAAAIVVLGRGEPFRHQRVDLAAQLWRSGRAPKIFASGMSDVAFIIDDLKNKGVPAQNLSGENCSQTTEENGLYTSAILQPQTHRKVLLITDPPHMLRSFLVFQSLGYLPIPKVSAFPEQLSPVEKVSSIIREVSGLIVYAFTGKFSLRTAEDMASSSVTVVHRLRAWNCKR